MTSRKTCFDCFVQHELTWRAVLRMFVRLFRIKAGESHFLFLQPKQLNLVPGLLGQRCLNLQQRCIFGVISSLNTKFFQIWSSVTGYDELCVCQS